MIKDLFSKCREFEDAKRVQEAGLYPYFRAIESTVGSSVVTHGKRRIMIGSNNYLDYLFDPIISRC